MSNPALVRRLGWWVLFVVCLLYAGFAFEMFRQELFSQIDDSLVDDPRERATPLAFLLHAVTGGVGLVCGALQFNGTLRSRHPRIHRIVGRLYLAGIWTASLSGLWNAAYFNVPVSAKVVFWLVGIWWFLATSKAFLEIRNRHIPAHRNWMLRSFAISLFFITFPIWVPGLQLLLSDAIAWPVGLLLAAALNMIVAEYWIRADLIAA
jgi:uncharacterized membrane protein